MDSGASVRDLLFRLVAAVDRAGVPYMVTGSIASSLHGEPRSTHDVDVVIDPVVDSLDRLLAEFPADEYHVSREAATSALQLRTMFNVIDLNTGWKADFIIRKDREFSRVEFERRQLAEVFGLRLYVASPEDVVVVKLEWAKSAESERQIRDASGILRLRQQDIDVPYIESWVEALGIRAQWEHAKDLASGR